MISRRRHAFFAAPALAVLAVLAALSGGCAGRSADTVWFVLDGAAGAPPMAEQCQGPRIQVRRIDIPGYLDRAAIVTREGGVRLRLAEFHAWAEPLAAGMRRALAEALTPLLLKKGMRVQAPDDDGHGALPLFVQVRRFDGVLGGEASLDADWSLRGSDDRLLARGSFTGREPAGTSYESLVKAESALLRRMAEALADPLAEGAEKTQE